jgi:lipoate-protein ligase A
MSNEVACEAVALREGLETSLDISSSGTSQRFLDFARNDRREDTTQCLFSSLQVYHDVLPHSAAMNMAMDEALLEHARIPSIRFYRWHSPALSFGYFGRFRDVANHASARDVVRRWTGGGIVFHGDDLTYSIVIPVSDAVCNKSSMSLYEKIHRGLCNALIANDERAELAVAPAIADRGGTGCAMKTSVSDPGYNGRRSLKSAVGDRRCSNAEPATIGRNCSCFANPVRADVMIHGRKVAGAAQRRTHAGLLQQGSIQGVELEDGLASRFAEELSKNCEPRSLPNAVECRAREIAAQKYATEAWLRKR